MQPNSLPKEEPIQITIILSKYAFIMAAMDDLISDIPIISPAPENAETLTKELNDKLKWLKNNMSTFSSLKKDDKAVTSIDKQIEFAYSVFKTFQEWLGCFIKNNCSIISNSAVIQNDVDTLLKYISHHDELRKRFEMSKKEDLQILENFSKIMKMPDLPDLSKK